MNIKIEIAFEKGLKSLASYSKSSEYGISGDSSCLRVKCESKLGHLLKRIEEIRNKLRETTEADELLKQTYSDVLLAMLTEKEVLQKPFEFRISNGKMVLERKIPDKARHEEKDIYIHYLKIHTREIVSDLFKEKSFQMNIDATQENERSHLSK